MITGVVVLGCRTQSDKVKLFRLFLKLILLVLFTIIFSDWLLGKIINTRTAGSNATQYWLLKIVPAAYVMSRHPPLEVSTSTFSCQINSQGFRHPATVPSHKTKPRVFILGGSVAYGVGASNDATVYLEYIRRSFPDIEFINAAGPSYISVQQWIHLALDILPLQPDGIIIIDGFNDLAIPVGYGDKPGMPYQWRIYEKLLSRNIFKIIITYAQTKSNFCRMYDRWKYSNYANSGLFQTNEFAQILDSYTTATQLTYDFCRMRDIKVWHVFQPQLITKKNISPAEQHFIFKPFADAMIKMYPITASRLQSVAADRNIPFLDLRNIFDNETNTIYVDFCHCNDRGQKIMGETIANFLKQQNIKECLFSH